MVESMFHLRRVQFRSYVCEKNNGVGGGAVGGKSGGKAGSNDKDALNDNMEPTKNPTLRAKSTYILCLALELTSAPNFRPNFKYFSWHSCALGAISTITMMLVIDASMSAVAIVILMLLIMILHYQAPIGSWGSISQALIYHQVRKYLLLLDSRKDHVKFWRPQMLLLVNKPATCCPLMDFVNDIKNSGLYVIGHVQRGSMESGNGGSMDPLQQVYPYWLSLVDYLRLKAFVELTLTENVRIGIQQLIRLSGMGAMKPNTVVLGFHESEPSQPILSETHLLKDLKFSKIGRIEVVEYFTAGDFVPKFSIRASFGMHSVNVKQVEECRLPRLHLNIAQFPNSFVKAVNEMIRRNSKDTAVCFLNLPLPPALTEDTQHDTYLQSLRLLTQDLPPTFLVHGLSSVISTAL
ncbi:solute carrier family 12 domain-containing protein [Ditylenchus destructor]|nr:solute carrier family 12 domain-containing protein [Ditylenchus destructor]